MRRTLLILYFISSFFSSELSAQFFAGGEIYYELLSSKKYKVTAHVYRMCDQSSLNNLGANVYGGSTVVAMSFQRTAISKINDTCGNPCDLQNKPSNPGFEKHTFVDTIDFNYAPYDVFITNNICTVNFGVRQSGRSATLTTHNSGLFYLDASVNICLSNIVKNTSPRFSMEPKFLVGCNQPMSYSPGPLDSTDNDSFSFSLVDVQSNYNTNLTYNNSLSSQIPMSPFCVPPGIVNCKALPNAKPPRGYYFDKGSCITGFTPVNCNEKGTIKYKIDEYRFNKQSKKYEWLGYVCREMFVQVVTGVNNTIPLFSGVNLYGLCNGDKLCFTSKPTDSKSTSQATDDTTALFWDRGIKDGTFRIVDSSAREKQAEFCWQTNKQSGRSENYFFTMASFDKMCNLNLTSKTFIIKTRPLPKYIYKNFIGGCGQVKWTAEVYDSMYPQFKGACITVIRSFQTNQVLFSGNKLNDSATIYENGKIIIEHTFYANSDKFCPVLVRDTANMYGAILLPDINDNSNQNVCKNSTSLFNFKASRINNLKSLKWTLNDSLINQTDTIISLILTKNSTIKLQIENLGGCASQRILTYNLKQHNAITSNNKTFCPGTLVTMISNISSLQRPVSYSWKVNGIDTLTNDSNLTIELKSNTKILLTLTDANQCVFTDSVTNSVWPAVSFSLNYKNEVCKDSATIVKAINIIAAKPFTYTWQIDKKDTANNDSALLLKMTKHLEVNLLIKDQNACSTKNTIVILAIKTPEVAPMNDIKTCYNSTINIIPTILNRPSQINYQWTYNKAIIGIDSFLNRKITTPQQIKLKVSNQLNCYTEEMVNISLFPQLSLTILNKTNYHPSSLIIVSTTKQYQSYQWFNGKSTMLDSFQASDLGPPGKYKIWCKTTDANGCTYQDTVEIFTNQFLDVKTQNLQSLKIYPNPVSDVLNMVVAEAASVSLFSSDGKLLGTHYLLNGLHQIDMTTFVCGVYYLKVMVKGDSGIFKIVKE